MIRKKNIWFIMGGTMLLTTVLVAFLQGCQPEIIIDPTPVAITVVVSSTPPPMLTELSSAAGVSPTISNVDPAYPPSGIETSTATPDVQQFLEFFDDRVNAIRAASQQIQGTKLSKDLCPYTNNQWNSGVCWEFQTDEGTKVVIQGFTSRPIKGLSFKFVTDVYVYDFDGNEEVDVIEWDLERDGTAEIVEYDIDGDGEFDYASADPDEDGQFDIYQSTLQGWRPLYPGVLPFPILPIFPY